MEAVTSERDRLMNEAHNNQKTLTEWIERATRAETRLQATAMQPDTE